jgi:hypothetical protein
VRSSLVFSTTNRRGGAKGSSKGKKKAPTWKELFLQEAWQSRPKKPRFVLAALKDLEIQAQLEIQTQLENETQLDKKPSLSEIKPDHFWERQVLPQVATTGVSTWSRLLETHDGFRQISRWGRQGRRFTSLLVWEQVRLDVQLARRENRTPPSETDLSQAIEQIATIHGVDSGAIKMCRREGQGWLQLVKHWGFGAMLLPETSDLTYVDCIPQAMSSRPSYADLELN